MPTRFNRYTGRFWYDPGTSPLNELTMGGNADSYYEYLLKMWLMTKAHSFCGALSHLPHFFRHSVGHES